MTAALLGWRFNHHTHSGKFNYLTAVITITRLTLEILIPWTCLTDPLYHICWQPRWDTSAHLPSSSPSFLS